MPVLLTDNIACERGLSNGTQGIFRELIYDDQEESGVFKVKSEVFPSNTIYIRKPLYALVEISTSQVETNLDGLRPKLIPIPIIKKRFTVPIKQLFGHLSILSLFEVLIQLYCRLSRARSPNLM
jgi:hypothetical protein